MIINTTQVEMVLMNSAIPAYSIESETNVPRNVISRLRRGDSQFENLSLKNIMRIQKWIDDGNFKISYDYTELIEELTSDIDEGLTDDCIYVVRGKYLEEIGTCPIVDFYYDPSEIREGDIAEKIPTKTVLDEMEFYNQP